MNKDLFKEELLKIGITIESSTFELLERYYEILIEWNEKMNLTNITEKEEVYLKHFYDSLTLVKAIDLKKDISVCDVGTGAGFPGIVLKIFFPNIKLTLVDSLGKRIQFLNEVIKKLELEDVYIENARGEEYIKKHREEFDLVTCRALSKLNIISEICLPGVKVGGYFIPMKGNIEEEIKNTNFITKLGGNIENIISFNLPVENSKRSLIVIKKINSSNLLYPREYTNIIKRPL